MPRRRKYYIEEDRDLRGLERRLRTMRSWLAVEKEALQFREDIREKRKGAAAAERRRRRQKEIWAKSEAERRAWEERRRSALA
ncbi:MAG TPA: hypothetical protein VNH64_04140 [Parvularculaceae bacterium]|nr:hypothetical protein [Parvularculaceae bacterium]